MNEYSVSDYGIFNDGVSTINVLNESLDTSKSTMEECKSSLNNDSVFMGPICDSCVEAFQNVDEKMTTIFSNFSKISTYLTDTASTYQSGDNQAAQVLLSIDDSGKVNTSTVKMATGGTSQDTVYNYLISQGFNNAAICGILSNMQHESGFNPNSLGDSGTSYGLCQWHAGRWANLKNYCANNNLDADSMEGQLAYLVYELKTSYTNVYNALQNVPNTSQGAYNAAYIMTTDFEAPRNKYSAANNRGNTASSTFWETYGV